MTIENFKNTLHYIITAPLRATKSIYISCKQRFIFWKERFVFSNKETILNEIYTIAKYEESLKHYQLMYNKESENKTYYEFLLKYYISFANDIQNKVETLQQEKMFFYPNRKILLINNYNKIFFTITTDHLPFIKKKINGLTIRDTQDALELEEKMHTDKKQDDFNVMSHDQAALYLQEHDKQLMIVKEELKKANEQIEIQEMLIKDNQQKFDDREEKLNNEIKRMNADLKEITEKNARYIQQIKSSEEEIKTLNDALSEIKEKYNGFTTLESNYHKSIQENEQLTATKEKLIHERAKIISENFTLYRETQAYDSRISNMQTEHQRETRNLKEDVRRLERENNNTKLLSEEYHKQAIIFQTTLANKRQENKSLRYLTDAIYAEDGTKFRLRIDENLRTTIECCEELERKIVNQLGVFITHNRQITEINNQWFILRKSLYDAEQRYLHVDNDIQYFRDNMQTKIAALNIMFESETDPRKISQYKQEIEIIQHETYNNIVQQTNDAEKLKEKHQKLYEETRALETQKEKIEKEMNESYTNITQEIEEITDNIALAKKYYESMLKVVEPQPLVDKLLTTLSPSKIPDLLTNPGKNENQSITEELRKKALEPVSPLIDTKQQQEKATSYNKEKAPLPNKEGINPSKKLGVRLSKLKPEASRHFDDEILATLKTPPPILEPKIQESSICLQPSLSDLMKKDIPGMTSDDLSGEMSTKYNEEVD